MRKRSEMNILGRGRPGKKLQGGIEFSDHGTDKEESDQGLLCTGERIMRRSPNMGSSQILQDPACVRRLASIVSSVGSHWKSLGQ